MSDENTSIISINIVRLATNLAEKRLRDNHFGIKEEVLTYWNGYTQSYVYREVYQEEFDKYYDEFYEIIENCKE